jgi:hypothetical protein
MSFNPRVWYPIAAVLSVANLIYVAFAVGPVQPWHAMVHATLAVGFGLWAQRLLDARRRIGLQDRSGEPEALGRLDDEMNTLRQGLAELQERLDFAERLLAERADPPPLGREVPRAAPNPRQEE